MPGDDELARTATAPGSSSGPAKESPALGDALGRYRLEREIGAGGMGVVHAAFDPDLERRVALKVLRSDGGEARQRLLREARALARLTHPNVVTVHEVGSANGRDYVAMELIEGETLADWLKAAPRSQAEILAAFVAAGRGLAAAHAAGLVHRDFKPHNVLRRKDGRIVVTDFGLARGVEAAIELEATLPLKEASANATTTPSSLSGLTQTGSVLGTPAYMAPEQWSGGTVGPPADQFAFCVALWEALAGERPFKGATLEALQADVRRGPGELDDSKLPRRLRGPLKRGLDPDPARRWPSMDALLAAISRAERPRGVWLMIAGSAVVATAVAYAVFATEEKQKEAPAPTCEAPVLEASAVWSPTIANQLRDKTSPQVMRRFDQQIGAWQAARDVACGVDTPMRARRLACLDGVIARIDAVRKAAMRGARPTLDQVGEQLIDPGVCNVDDPPRLPAHLSEAAITALALAYQPESQAEFDEAAETAALQTAGDDKCARAFVRLARAQNDTSTKARDAADEAAQLADACGDDRVRADALVALVGMQITMYLDPKLQKALAVAEAAVRKVSQADLVAQLDLVKADIAATSGQWDEEIKLAESAIRGFGEQRPQARLQAAYVKVRALMGRRHPHDLEAAQAELARWRPDVEKLGSERMLVAADAFDLDVQWELGDVAGANQKWPALRERLDKTRKKPLTDGTTVTGVVVDGTGKPVADALVAAGEIIAADSYAIGYLGNDTDTRLGKTDAQGRYSLDHVKPRAIIVAQSGDLRSRVKTAKDNDKLVLEPTTTISGHVAGNAPSQLTLFVVNGDRDVSQMYQMLTPVASDGSFTIARVPTGHLRIGAALIGAAMGQSFAMQDITVGPKGKTDLEVKPAEGRKLRVIARSSLAVPISGATVVVVGGSISLKTVKELQNVLRSPGVAIEVARGLTGETPPELGKLLSGDLVATFANAPAGGATACAFGLSGDLSDPGYRQKVQQHIDEVEVRCVPVAPDAKAVTVEVPPMKRMD